MRLHPLPDPADPVAIASALGAAQAALGAAIGGRNAAQRRWRDALLEDDLGRTIAARAALSDRLPGVEASVRNVPGTPRQLISEEVVYRWCRPGDRMPGALNQEGVQLGHGGVGFMRTPNGQAQQLVRRKFIERRFVEAAHGNPAYVLATRLNLPGLRADDAPFFIPADPIATPSPREVLRMLDKLAAQAEAPTAPAPAEKVELELVGAFDRDGEMNQPVSLLDRIAS